MNGDLVDVVGSYCYLLHFEYLSMSSLYSGHSPLMHCRHGVENENDGGCYNWNWSSNWNGNGIGIGIENGNGQKHCDDGICGDCGWWKGFEHLMIFAHFG